jgi:hypothetical protein
MAALWQEIDEVLYPVVGHRGVAALYQRSLTIAAAARPWLAPPSAGPRSALDTASLHAALLGQDADQAIAGGDALLGSFRTLLASLLGASLTERLLRPVWAHAAHPTPAQDKAP